MTDWATFAGQRARRRAQADADDAAREAHEDDAREPFDGSERTGLDVDEWDDDTAAPTAGSHGWLLDAWAATLSVLQYTIPLVLTPVGGLVGMSYADLGGAAVGALLGLLLALLLMPLARRIGYAVVAIPARLVGRFARRPILYGLLAAAAALLIMEIMQ